MNRPAAPESVNPFPGLRPFRENEEHLFFGRESQVDSMIDTLAATRLLAVVGTSGSGKSSLVNCGLFPALHRGLMAKAGTSWRIAPFRPGSNPLRSMARALARDKVLFTGFDSGILSLDSMIEATLRLSKLGLVDVYEQAHLGKGINLLVVVDQFEELFRYGTQSEEAAAFVKLLLGAIGQIAYPIFVVLTMRSDFLGDCTQFPGLPEAINEGQYLVPRLAREERRAAIAGPVGVGGARITPVLLTRLVNDVGDNPDQLSILQHALNRTWTEWQRSTGGGGPLDLPHYQAIGTMAHALDRHAEDAYEELGTERQKRICEKIFKALTDTGTDPRGIRRPTSLARLCGSAGVDPNEPEEVIRVIDVFRDPSRSFLVPPWPEPLDRDSVIDISHESLMRVWERLKVWTTEEARSARLYRRLSEAAALHAAGQHSLWHGPELQLALQWREKEKPVEAWGEFYGGGIDQAMSFLDQSKVQREREEREKEEFQRRELRQAQALAEEQRRRVEEQTRAARKLRKWLAALAALAVAAVLLVGAVAYAWVQQSRAIESQQRAESRADAARLRAEAALLGAEAAKNNAVQALNKVSVAEKLANQRANEAEIARAFAVMQKEAAEKADNDMRLEALRVTDESLNTQSTLVSLADSLLQYSSPRQSAVWYRMKGGALMQQGDWEGGYKFLSNALELAPDDSRARTSRGYLSILRNRPEDALNDFEYIRDHIDPASCLNNLNLAITYAELGKYPEARASLKQAMQNVHYGGFQGGNEAFIPPDITTATGRTTLDVDPETFDTALYYMRANLEAYAGNAGAFQDALGDADTKARALSSASRKDAYFAAMVWAWLHLRLRCPDGGAACKDYAAFISQAQLWDRAGYKDWASCYYEKFQVQDRAWPDPRYVAFRAVANQGRAKLGLPASFSCKTLADRPPDVPALVIKAREAEARKNYSHANELLDQAIDKASEAEKVHLFLRKADVLYWMGRTEQEKSGQANFAALADGGRLREKTAQKKAEEDRLQNLAQKDTSEGASAKKKLDEKYAPELAELQSAQAKDTAEAKEHDRLSKKAFHDLQVDCDEIVKKDPTAAVAYFYLAVAQEWLDPNSKSSKELVLANIGKALKLDPTYSDALEFLDNLAPDSDSKEGMAYLERYRDSLDLYHRLSPFTPRTFMHQAKLANSRKRYIEALDAIETAISMEPENTSFYEIRAEAERGLDVSESQVKRDLADGYRQAGDILKRRGKSSEADIAYQAGWNALTDLAKRQEKEEILCDANITTCNITKTIQANGEWIYGGVLSVGTGGGAVREARIDKGSDDGIVVGAQGFIWSVPSTDKDGHQRRIANLGTGEVLAVQPDSALVRIRMVSAQGDGLVRTRDCLRLKARTPVHPKDSRLWELVKYNVTVQDVRNNKIMDYRTLYSGETPELEDKLRRTMLDNIHEAGRLYGDQWGELMVANKTIQQLGGKTVRQTLENATLADLNRALEHAAKYPGDYFGQEWSVAVIYLGYVMSSPADAASSR
jgi:hypothetical protein